MLESSQFSRIKVLLLSYPLHKNIFGKNELDTVKVDVALRFKARDQVDSLSFASLISLSVLKFHHTIFHHYVFSCVPCCSYIELNNLTNSNAILCTNDRKTSRWESRNSKAERHVSDLPFADFARKKIIINGTTQNFRGVEIFFSFRGKLLERGTEWLGGGTTHDRRLRLMTFRAALWILMRIIITSQLRLPPRETN